MLASAYVSEVDGNSREKIFLRIDPKAKEAWIEMCRARKIEQTTAGEAMVEWIVAQEPEVQAMILGQLPPKDDLVAMVLGRLAGGRPFDIVWTDLVKRPPNGRSEKTPDHPAGPEKAKRGGGGREPPKR